MIYSDYQNQMDISAFQTFLAAAATGSFAGAAQRVHASPSAVTERIKQLEHRLGARLFERDKRGCRLTATGRRFLEPARQAVRAWDIARHDIALPEEFTRSVSVGGQFALWRDLLVDWLAEARQALPDVAFRVTAGAAFRLNRDLAEGFLDMAILYDPVFRKDIASEKLFDDRLILVSGASEGDWHERYVEIVWGQGLSVEIASQLHLAPEAGLVLDLGNQSARWLIEQKMSGFMPERLVAHQLASGELRRIDEVPSFDYPAYVCWRRDLDAQLAAQLVGTVRSITQ